MDMDDTGSIFVAFTDAQLITATSSLAAAISEMRKETLDEDITDREAHIIMLLGTRGALTRNGKVLDPMTATRLYKKLQADFGVSDATAENDVRRLKSINILECFTDPTDGRVREVMLTEVGETLYELLAQRAATLILALAELLQNYGAVPVDPLKMSKPYLRDYAAFLRKAD